MVPGEGYCCSSGTAVQAETIFCKTKVKWQIHLPCRVSAMQKIRQCIMGYFPLNSTKIWFSDLVYRAL